jgi:hypothetical protein
MMRAGLQRGTGLVAALALGFTPAASLAAAATCPDQATVQAARVVEFQTMMMSVSVRCKHVGVVISDHLDQMTGARRTMLSSANDRVAAYLRGLGTAAPAAPAPAPAPAPTLAAPPAAKAPPGKSPPARARSAKAALAKGPAAKPPAGKAPAGKPATAAPPAKPAAKVSRRTDPFDRYLTMIGNQYGAGMTTLQRCKAFDAIVTSLSDKTNTDRLLTMVSASLVQVTLLEAIVNCPPGK